MMDWTSTETTGDGLLCVQIIQLSTLYTQQLVTVRGLQNQIVNHARVRWVGFGRRTWQVDLTYDAAATTAYPVFCFTLFLPSSHQINELTTERKGGITDKSSKRLLYNPRPPISGSSTYYKCRAVHLPGLCYNPHLQLRVLGNDQQDKIARPQSAWGIGVSKSWKCLRRGVYGLLRLLPLYPWKTEARTNNTSWWSNLSSLRYSVFATCGLDGHYWRQQSVTGVWRHLIYKLSFKWTEHCRKCSMPSFKSALSYYRFGML